MPSSIIIPVLSYPDLEKALKLLCDGFNFNLRLRIGDHRAQLKIGESDLIIAKASICNEKNGTMKCHEIMIRITDIDSHYQHVKEFDVKILQKPTDFPYGERQYSVVDFVGHIWTFSQSINDVDPESWGGKLVDNS